MRRKVRDRFAELHLLQRMVRDIKILLQDEPDEEPQEAIYLWDNLKGHVEYGISYAKFEDKK